MPPDKLVPSIFKGERGIPRDEEAYELWKQYVPADRILELGLDDNFWQMGDTGPCGRCSEIYYVRGSGSDPEIEIWNNVFMEFERERRRHADAAARAVDRHRHGPRAAHGGAPAEGLQLRHRRLHADPRRDRTARRARLCRHAWRRRRLDAGRRRSHSRDDVPDRGRRDPVQRMARLRAAQDHAPRDAARQAPRHHRAVPPPARRRPRSGDGRRLSGSARESRDGREDDSRGGAPVRHRADRRPAAARSGDRQGPRVARPRAVGRRGLPPLRHLRPAVRLHRGHRGDAGS